LIKTTKKYHVSFMPLKLSETLKDQLPAWLHPGAPPKTYHKGKNRCLEQTHKIKSVQDLRDITMRLTNQRMHQPRAPCPCDKCTEDQLAGCQNPHKCAQTAKNILDNLLPKFNPNTTPRKDNLTLMHRRLEKNARARTQPQGEVLFDPTITARDNLSDCFHIFTLPSRPLQIPAYRLRIPAVNRQMNNEALTIF
ncbi:hypothetical protein BDR03DRAFT_819995, partial [Suillus americanus]